MFEPHDPPAIDESLARRLLAAQFPQWADLPLAREEPGGSDHVIFRLGAELAVRLPRGPWAAGQAAKEHTWLPRLAPRLPLAVPVPLGLGRPALGYPWCWSVTRWLDGAPPTPDSLDDLTETAVELAGFLRALRRLPTDPALAPGPHNDHLGSPLSTRDRGTRAAIDTVARRPAGSEGARPPFEARALTAAWQAALDAPRWGESGEPPVWIHGDLHPGNLLAVGGRLHAVIDFGGLGVGDPACDLVIAWTLLDAASREVFRASLGVDDATWTRGRGWALSTGLNAHAHYAATNPRIAAATHHQITQALA